MSTWAALIAEVQAQIAVSDDVAYDWLLDCARVMNAEAAWLLTETTLPGVTGQQEYPLPDDCVSTEAVVVNGRPYHRGTLGGMDEARAYNGTRAIYTDAVDTSGESLLALWPVVTGGAQIVLRYIAEVPDDRAGSPPFPADFHQNLADAGIARGLARLDERFDSAGYFDARFTDAVQRLKRRRHGHVGRGGTPIRIVR